MAISKKHREIIFNKCNGRCAYCGELLEKRWHVDEVEPIKRKYHYDIGKRKWVQNKNKENKIKYPDRLNLDNQLPACAYCNINKHDMSLEEFRSTIENYTKFVYNI